jgi:hypothetical protein
MQAMITLLTFTSLALCAAAHPHKFSMSNNTDHDVHTLPYHPPILPRHANNTMPHTHLPDNKNTFPWRFYTGTFITMTVLFVLFIIGNVVVWWYPKYSGKRKTAKRDRDMEMAFGGMQPGSVAGVAEPARAARVGRERE